MIAPHIQLSESLASDARYRAHSHRLIERQGELLRNLLTARRPLLESSRARRGSVVFACRDPYVQRMMASRLGARF